MAGSYKHATNDQGQLRSPRHMSIATETPGDAYETITEMYGMIWYLANGNADRVETARRYYLDGLDKSPGKEDPNVRYDDEDEPVAPITNRQVSLEARVADIERYHALASTVATGVEFQQVSERIRRRGQGL
jgi:hypothetical protein